ncbi:protein XNDC1N [Candoia aspera]|uniref:protein XNDC1N n=1 Tax=Candoia aspera TaxID=51853 RepID=UPI002FD7AD7F
MAPLRIRCVVSFSSQDPKYPVDNLLLEENIQPWLCCPLDRSRQLKAELQLEQASCIGYIDVGNCGSAFLQIDVGRSSWPPDQNYLTLLPTTTLMMPADAKLNNNRSGVRMFKEGDLLASALAEKWDRVRLTCSQPFNRHAQFGLSFIRIRTPRDAENSQVDPAASSPCQVLLWEMRLLSLKQSHGSPVQSLAGRSSQQGCRKCPSLWGLIWLLCRCSRGGGTRTLSTSPKSRGSRALPTQSGKEPSPYFTRALSLFSLQAQHRGGSAAQEPAATARGPGFPPQEAAPSLPEPPSSAGPEGCRLCPQASPSPANRLSATCCEEQSGWVGTEWGRMPRHTRLASHSQVNCIAGVFHPTGPKQEQSVRSGCLKAKRRRGSSHSSGGRPRNSSRREGGAPSQRRQPWTSGEGEEEEEEEEEGSRPREGDAVLGTCPICAGSFPARVLPVHASGCGEEADTAPSPPSWEAWVGCPICQVRFPAAEVEGHASSCGEDA